MLLLSFIHTKHRHKICCLHCAVFNRQICNAQLDLTLIVMQQWLAENRKKNICACLRFSQKILFQFIIHSRFKSILVLMREREKIYWWQLMFNGMEIETNDAIFIYTNETPFHSIDIIFPFPNGNKMLEWIRFDNKIWNDLK